jgi:rubrerythrin
MAAEEDQHRRSLINLYRRRFGEIIVPIRRERIRDFYTRRPVWLVEHLPLDRIRQEALSMEQEAQNSYGRAAARARDADARKLLGDLAAAEGKHGVKAEALTERHLAGEERQVEDQSAGRQLILTWVQPGLAGLMDGSVSTLAPIFATAFATQNPWTTFLSAFRLPSVPVFRWDSPKRRMMTASCRARGSPWKRGLASGVMTMIGGLGHALPYLIPSFWTATIIALVVVFIELWAIVWIQNRFMETPFLRATFQVVLGGALVLAAGIVIGGS